MLSLRPSQVTAYEALQGKPCTILNAPTGWGKSLVLSALGSKSQRCIVAIPQKAISKGFLEDRILMLPSGEELSWHVDLDLCAASRAKVQQLRQFLISGSKGKVVTTHQTLALAWRSLETDDYLQAAHNLHLVIDEAHHLQASEDASNRLGDCIDNIIDSADPTSSILLATAFFFRGDGLPIVHESKVDTFIRHTIPIDEYWQSLKHLKSYKYDFVTFKASPLPELKKLLKSSQEPTIVYLPREGHHLHLGRTKTTTVNEVVAAFQVNYKDSRLWHNGTTYNNVIIDLVSLENRSEKLAFVAKYPERVIAILAVAMFREGADWVHAQRVIDLVPSGSDQDRGQRFGRLLRDHASKSTISYYSFLPFLPDQTLEFQREQLSRLFAHFHASLVLENALSPIRIRMPSSAKTKSKDQTESVDCLGELPSNQQHQILSECYSDLVNLASQGPVSAEAAKEAVFEVLNGHGLPKAKLDPLARQIAALMRRRSQGTLVSDDLLKAGFDKIWSEKILSDVQAFVAGVGGPKTFAEIRQAIAGAFDLRWTSNYDQVAKMINRPGFHDPNYKWIMYVIDLYKKGQLPQDRIKDLESINWWSWNNLNSDKWQETFDRVSKLPAYPHHNENAADHIWCKTQWQYRATMSQDRIKALESIKWWTWSLQDDRWLKQYNAMAAMPFAPKAIRGETSPEYKWCHHQRRCNHKSKLSEERIKLLEQIPWWVW